MDVPGKTLKVGEQHWRTFVGINQAFQTYNYDEEGNLLSGIGAPIKLTMGNFKHNQCSIGVK